MIKPWLICVVSLCICLQVSAKCYQRQTADIFNPSTLLEDLTLLSAEKMSGRKTGSAGSVRAQYFLERRFQDLGLIPFAKYPNYVAKFSFPNASYRNIGVNIIGWLKGKYFPERFIIVTAHYDHLGKRGRHVFYGANDNASGVATLLVLAQKASTQAMAHSVIFLATDAEEKGLHGAKAFIRDLPITREAVRLNINLDMLGWGGRKNRLYATYTKGHEQLTDLVRNIAAISPVCLIDGHRKSRGVNQIAKNVNWRKASDHAVFAKVGIPYIFIGGGIDKNYHTPQDKFENIDQTFYLAATESAWLVLQAADKFQ